MGDRLVRRRGLFLPGAILALATAFTLSSSRAQVCTVADQTQCQTANAFGLTSMDAYNGPPYAVADDFIAETTSVDQVCWTVGFLPTPGNPPCYESPPSDYFRIKIFEDLNGVPGVLLHNVDPAFVSDKQWHGGTSVLWDYTKRFNPPLGGFVPGRRYWLEIFGSGNSRCMVNAALSLDGNGYHMAEYDAFSNNQEWTFEDRAPTPDDIAFCIGGTDSPATTIPPQMTGACCQCDGTCTDDVSLTDCVGQQCTSPDCAALCPSEDPVPPCNIGPVISDGTFFPLQACSQIACDPFDPNRTGETCEDPIIAPISAPAEIVSLPFQTTCSSTDGPITYPNGCDSGPVFFENDVWIEFEASCTGFFHFDFCGDTDYDAAVAIYSNGTSRCPNIDEATGERTICPPSLDDLVDGQCLQSLCSDVPGQPTYYTRCVGMGTCFLIRIGGNQDAGQGVVNYKCSQGICFPAEPPYAQPIPDAEFGNGAMVASVKNRVLSFRLLNVGRFGAVRVKFIDLPGPFSIYNGESLWVGPPVEYDERPGVGYDKPCDSNCQPGADDCSQCTGETFFGAELQCDPYYTDWSVFDTVHVRNELIVPSTFAAGGGIDQQAVYSLQQVDDSCCGDFQASSFSDPLILTTTGWGDVAELYDGQFVAPDDVVSLADTLAVIQEFTGAPDSGNLLSKVRVDLVGVGPSGPSPVVDGVISVLDIVEILTAFGGGGYVFDPGPWPCP